MTQMSFKDHVEITDENANEHLTCTQMSDEDNRRYCVGWHCSHCGKATGMYGHYRDGSFTCKEDES